MSEYRTLHGEGPTWRTVVLTSLLGAVLALAVCFLTPVQYSSSIRILITQVNATGLDPYTAVKSTERIAQTLSELMYSTTFYTNVVTQARDFDTSYFPTDEYERRKLWSKTIESSVAAGTGILTVTAYHPVRTDARKLVDSAAKEIVLQTPSYFGSTVRAQVIDSPLDSRWIARPEYVKNTLFGLFLGFLVGIAWLLFKQIRWRF